MKKTVFTVAAYRFGDREKHSYILGVYEKKHAALKAAENESADRGNKYQCEVLEFQLNAPMDEYGKVILALVPSPFLDIE